MDQNERAAPSLFDEGMVRVGEAATLLGVSRSFLYQMMERGELSFWKLGKCRRIPKSALTKLMSDHMVPVGAAKNGAAADCGQKYAR